MAIDPPVINQHCSHNIYNHWNVLFILLYYIKKKSLIIYFWHFGQIQTKFLNAFYGKYLSKWSSNSANSECNALCHLKVNLRGERYKITDVKVYICVYSCNWTTEPDSWHPVQKWQITWQDNRCVHKAAGLEVTSAVILGRNTLPKDSWQFTSDNSAKYIYVNAYWHVKVSNK